MYAHQVIEDMKATIIRLNQLEVGWPEERRKYGDYDHAIEIFLEAMANSQKFHFDDVDSLIEIGKSADNCKLFMESESIPLEMPYKNMWIDFSVKNGHNKWGILIYRYDAAEFCKNPQFELFCFEYAREVNRWIMAPTIKTIQNGFIISEYKANHYKENIENDLIVACASLGHKSIMLLNCKNITTEKIFAPEALNKKRRKSGKQELFDYHVLNVVVPSKKRGYRESTDPLFHNRVHLCRGHFKEYTSEHPLFGRYTGLYWWQPHVRGQNKDGIVMKEYNVHAADSNSG